MLSLKNFSCEKATVSVGRKIVKVVSEPCIKDVRFNDRFNAFLHFEARGKYGELVICTAYNDRARRAVKELNIGDEVVIDESVDITAIDNSLEYKFYGTYII